MTERPNDWNPVGEDVLADGRTAFDHMREKCPVAYSDWRGWTLFKYADIVAVSQDVETFSSDDSWQEIHPDNRSIPLRLDPPEHGPFRRMLANLMRPDRIRGFESTSRQLCGEMLDTVIKPGRVEMVDAFCDPYPVRSLCRFLGWPVEDAEMIKNWSLDVTTARTKRDIDLFNSTVEAWDAYIQIHLDKNAVDPGENVSAWLLEQSVDGEKPTRTQLTSILRLLLQAGHGTTTSSTGICIAYLARNPKDQQRLREDAALIPTAIEEILRFDNPLTQMTRIVKRDTVIGGRTIKAGEDINLNYIAANRDPDAFDRADECLIDRRPNRHLVFGTGIHTCIGAPLARLEIKIALEELLKRTTNFRIAPGEQPIRETYIRNEHRFLPLEFD